MQHVTLHDGRLVSTDSDEWKIECLANYCLSLEFDKRKGWIEEVRARAGDGAADALTERVKAIHQASKAKGDA